MQQQTILLESRLESDGNNVSGFTRRFFATRPDLLAVDIREVKTRYAEQQPKGVVYDISALLTTYAERLGPDDYAVEERLNYEKKPFCLCGEPVSNWHPVLGNRPAKFDFGIHWAHWVSRELVQHSAREYISQHEPRAKPYFQMIPKTYWDLNSVMQDYIAIADMVLPPSKVKWLLEKTCCRYFNKASVAAMPIRIAQEMRRNPRWQPPIPKPTHESPTLGLQLIAPTAPTVLAHLVPKRSVSALLGK